jgi:hypothetical protein
VSGGSLTLPGQAPAAAPAAPSATSLLTGFLKISGSLATTSEAGAAALQQLTPAEKASFAAFGRGVLGGVTGLLTGAATGAATGFLTGGQDGAIAGGVSGGIFGFIDGFRDGWNAESATEAMTAGAQDGAIQGVVAGLTFGVGRVAGWAYKTAKAAGYIKAGSVADRAGQVVVWLFGGGNCFPPDTLVDTETGLRAIASIERGDRVWAYDFERGEWQLAEVMFRHDSEYDGPLVTIEVEEGALTSTAYHPFWVVEGADLENRPAVRFIPAAEDRDQSLDGRWVNSHDLVEGDTVYIRHGGPARVVHVAQRHEQTPICNLTIRGLHTFSVGEARVLVHNTSGGGGKVPRPPGPRILSPGDAFEAAVKRTFRGKIISQNEILRDATGRVIGEIDFETAEAIVEVGLSLRGKLSQLHKLAAIAVQRGKQLIVVYGPETAPGTLGELKRSLRLKWGNRVRFVYHG